METSNTHSPEGRPLGFWLRTVDALLDRAFVGAFAAEDASRRDWMLLNAVDGTVDAPWLAERLARRSGRVRRLIERGWISDSDGLTLTEAGRAAKERLGAVVDGIRARVAGAVGPEEFATTMASLEAIAREFGWDESHAGPFLDGKGRHGPHRHGFGRGGLGRHGVAHGDSGRHGFWHGGDPRGRHADAPCGRLHHRGYAHDGAGDGAYERGFAAGFTQGRSASDSAA